MSDESGAGDARPDAGEEPASAAVSRAWPRHGVSFGEALRTWAYVGLASFGGPAAQIAVMHRVVVDEKRWIGEQRFLHALNYCMLLPGPEAMQLATYIGWLMHRTRGALAAGLLFILPGFFAMMALSVLYATSNRVATQLIFYGIKAAVLAIVIQAVVRIGKRALPNRAMVTIAAASFVAIFFFKVPFPVIIAGAILLGLFGSARWPDVFKPGKGHGGGTHADHVPPLLPDDAVLPVSRSPIRALGVVGLWVAIWFAPVVVASWLFGPRSVHTEIGVFFSKAAMVTFGGAYAVLGYVAQHAPNVGWLMPGEMLDGLGMAETTPGPLILVLQFVGFMACFRRPPTEFHGALVELDPMSSGVFGATLATWVTFAPCFMWIFLGAPYMESLRHSRRIGAALSTVTAAVVGVVLSLAAWFAVHTVFMDPAPFVKLGAVSVPAPALGSFDLGAAMLAILALYLVFRLKWGMLSVILACAVSGAAVMCLRWAVGWSAG